MFKKELRVCNTCGLMMGEKDVLKHSIETGHMSYSIVRLNEQEILKRLLSLEVRVGNLEKRIEKSEEFAEKIARKEKEELIKKKKEEFA